MRALEPRPQQRLVGGRLAVREHPDRNLRPVAEERVADRALPRTDHLDDVAALGVHVHHVGAINPRMSRRARAARPRALITTQARQLGLSTLRVRVDR